MNNELQTKFEHAAEVLQRPAPKPAPKPVSLTAHEREIMLRLARGKRVHEIAAELFRSPSTISTYRLRILQKLGLANNAELAIFVDRVERQAA